MWFVAIAVILSSVLLSLTGTASAEEGQIRILGRRIHQIAHVDCERTRSCSLREILFQVENYTVEVHGGLHYGTRLYASYTTDTVEALTQYGFVQFIKGCQYMSRVEHNSPLSGSSVDTLISVDESEKSDAPQILFNVRRYFFGSTVEFRHMDWVIDSNDTDPMYGSSLLPNRHAYYRWNEQQFSFDEQTERFFGDGAPPYPFLYVMDLPGTAFYMNGAAKNVDLHLKMCLYKADAIPMRVEPHMLNFAEPLYCFYWNSTFVYNHDIQTFEYYEGVSSACGFR